MAVTSIEEVERDYQHLRFIKGVPVDYLGQEYFAIEAYIGTVGMKKIRQLRRHKDVQKAPESIQDDLMAQKMLLIALVTEPQFLVTEEQSKELLRAWEEFLETMDDEAYEERYEEIMSEAPLKNEEREVLYFDQAGLEDTRVLMGDNERIQRVFTKVNHVGQEDFEDFYIR